MLFYNNICKSLYVKKNRLNYAYNIPLLEKSGVSNCAMILLLNRYFFRILLNGGVQIILCECGEFIEGNTFKDYIKTSANPSTPTIGHCKCGLIFDFIDYEKPKKYSSKKELKNIAIHYAEMHNFNYENIERFLLKIERLKSIGNLSDYEILTKAIRINK